MEDKNGLHQNGNVPTTQTPANLPAQVPGTATVQDNISIQALDISLPENHYSVDKVDYNLSMEQHVREFNVAIFIYLCGHNQLLTSRGKFQRGKFELLNKLLPPKLPIWSSLTTTTELSRTAPHQKL